MENRVIQLHKVCRHCESLDIPLWNLKKKNYICKSCDSKAKKENYLKNREYYINQSRANYKEQNKSYGSKHWANITLAGLRYFDKTKNKYPICNINKDFLLQIIKEPCVYCGDSIDRIGVDRIDNDIGHTTTNLVPSCYSCNSVRMSNWTHEEMKTLGKAIAEIKARRRRI